MFHQKNTGRAVPLWQDSSGLSPDDAGCSISGGRDDAVYRQP